MISKAALHNALPLMRDARRIMKRARSVLSGLVRSCQGAIDSPVLRLAKVDDPDAGFVVPPAKTAGGVERRPRLRRFFV